MTGFYQTLKEEQRPALLRVFHRTEREGIVPNILYSQQNPYAKMNTGVKFLRKILAKQVREDV